MQIIEHANSTGDAEFSILSITEEEKDILTRAITEYASGSYWSLPHEMASKFKNFK